MSITQSRLDRELHLIAMQRLREREKNMSAPDQRITMLVNSAREVVKEAEEAAAAQHRAERMIAEWDSYLSPRIKSLAAVLKQFEDVP